MTTRIIVSIPYIHPGDEVVVETLQKVSEEVPSELVKVEVIRLVGVKEYTIWGSQYLNIFERRLTDENR